MNTELYIDSIENEAQRVIVEILNDCIMSLHPQMTTKFRYRIPFYDVFSWICYLNPRKKGGVELVFLAGKELEDKYGLLDNKGRKMVRGITFYSVEDINIDHICYYLLQAIMIDEERKNNKT